jgi:hypothetical protein
VGHVTVPLILTNGSKLNITGTADTDVGRRILGLVVDGSSGGSPYIVGQGSGAEIVLGSYGYIDIYVDNILTNPYNSDIKSVNHNFYDSDGKKEERNSLQNATYTWTPSLNGGGSGWKSNKGQHGEN